MKINTEIIRALNLCESGFNNYLNHYSKFDGTIEDFILLGNISYSDKVCVFTRLATKKQNVKWALLCASKVLSLFETECPNDDRPRKALEAVEAYLDNPCEETRSAAKAAARSAWAAAASAARSARPAWAAAEAAASATRSTAAEAAARSAAWSTEAARSAEVADIEEEVNLLFMVEAIREEA